MTADNGFDLTSDYIELTRSCLQAKYGAYANTASLLIALAMLAGFALRGAPEPVVVAWEKTVKRTSADKAAFDGHAGGTIH